MFSSISSINSIATKTIVIPIPNTYFTFNTLQTSGTTVTSVISSATVDSTTMTLSNSAATTTTGQKEGTANFYGGNKLYYGESTNISLPATNGISVSLWFKSVTNISVTSQSTTFLPMVSIGIGSGTTATSMIYFQVNTAIPWNFEIYAKASSQKHIQVQSGLNALDWNWHHLVLIWNGTNIKTYYDKVLVLNEISAPTLTSTNVYTSVCVNSRTNSKSLIGNFNIDCLRLYNKVLSAGEINAIYKAGI